MSSDDNSVYVARHLQGYLKGYIQHGDVSMETLKVLLSSFDRQKQQQILDCRVGDNTLVTLSCERNRLDLVQYFITDCDLDVNAQQKFDNETCSMLRWACRGLKQDLIELLLQNGAEINISDKFGKGPLHYIFPQKIGGKITGRGISEIIKLLIDNGVKVDGKSCNGETPLMFACRRKHAAEACAVLILQGADVNAVDGSGNSPLHYHCGAYSSCGDVEVLKVLLKSGANLCQKNERNKTPIDCLIQDCCNNYTPDNYPPFRPLKLTSAIFRGLNPTENCIPILLGYIAPKNKYHTLEIFGAMFALNRHDVDYAVRLWEQAHTFKSEFPELECCRDPEGDIVSDVPEYEGSEQFKHLKRTDTAAVLKQAMIKSYRHLEFHCDLTPLLCLALLELYVEDGSHGLGLKIFKQLLDFITEDERYIKLLLANSKTLERLMKTFVSYWFHILKHLDCQEYSYCLKLISILLKLFERRGLNTTLDPTYGYWVIDFLKHFTESGLEMPQEARKALQTCILYNMRFADHFHDGDLFHLVCESSSESKLSTLQILLQNGMAANAVDTRGNTALHKNLLRRKQIDGDLLNENKLLDFLLNNTYLDIPNNEGETPLDLLSRHKTVYPPGYITLKCLAARVISHHKILYVGSLPKSLQIFVAMH